MTNRLDEPLRDVLGARSAGPLATMEFITVGDLLRHYPRRYDEPGTPSDLGFLVLGERVTVVAQVARVTVRQMRARSGAVLHAVVTDGAHEVSVTFFARRAGGLRHHESRLVPGRMVLLTGVVSEYRGERQLTHPEYRVIGVDADAADEESALSEASKPIPIYPASATVPSWRIQACIRMVLDPLKPEDIPDPLPPSVRASHRLCSAIEALRGVHQPTTHADWRRAHRRLRFDEAFIVQVALAKRRLETAQRHAIARPYQPDGLRDHFDQAMPFTMTPGQQQVGDRIAQDLSRTQPMQRLLQGDVGAGKTLVALRAMLQVVDAGGQAALLAPTEVLAAQHVRTIRTMLGPLGERDLLDGAVSGTQIAHLTGSQRVASRRQALADVASGAAGIVIGTHALLSEQVQFADLGLLIVDEQHRFGVEQRDALRERSAHSPHLLVMTATPIPRTVAMTVFGDLETSTLSDMPPGRQPVTTHVVPAQNAVWVERVWHRIREEVDQGHRVYVVCARVHGDQENASTDLASGDIADHAISSGDAAPVNAVVDTAAMLRRHPALSGVDIGVLHGQMSPADKDDTMARFAQGHTPVLVATTVIEVGVDVPEATLMVIVDADRFGISQLHQLRGRVGRGQHPGMCLLVSSAQSGSVAATRVETLARTTDGFELAAVDLDLRSEGDILGAAQSGRSRTLRLLRVVKDADVIAQARQAATELIAEDPSLEHHLATRTAVEALIDEERQEFLTRS